MLTKPSRVVIENIRPAVDDGRFSIKRTLGDTVAVRADIHADGHDVLRAIVKIRGPGETAWTLLPLTALSNDEWEGAFDVTKLGAYEYGFEAWIDRFETWRRFLEKKIAARQDIHTDLGEGAQMLEAAAAHAPSSQAFYLREQARALSAENAEHLPALLRASALSAALAAYGERGVTAVHDRLYKVQVEPVRARFGAWYEMFPRSAGGTLKQAESRLPYIADLGFDVLYLPPIHPIGEKFRKGPNNTLPAHAADPGSPWAIGSSGGGHTALHPGLGTLKDFEHFAAAAEKKKLAIALDLAFQCSPDHPYVQAHPEWFRHRLDGSIKYAENPPKKYEDIYPLDFEGEAWESLWQELRRVVFFWIKLGVTIFRVDNPHTKPYRFWEWLIAEVRQEHPETIFLAEAFTRPKVMAMLAKCGFSQSYSYFTWRNSKAELTDYFLELNQPPLRDFMRPNLFANTPDILHAFLQTGGRPAFLIRLFLAATLGASYGIYGPPFELCEDHAHPGTEEYVDSEKYQVRAWNLERAGHIKEEIKKVNQIRRENPALQRNESLRFHRTDQESLLAYSKASPDGRNVILTVVNLDPQAAHDGNLRFIPPGLSSADPYTVHDLLSGARYGWSGETHYVRLDPQTGPAHIFRVEKNA